MVTKPSPQRPFGIISFIKYVGMQLLKRIEKWQDFRGMFAKPVEDEKKKREETHLLRKESIEECTSSSSESSCSFSASIDRISRFSLFMYRS